MLRRLTLFFSIVLSTFVYTAFKAAHGISDIAPYDYAHGAELSGVIFFFMIGSMICIRFKRNFITSPLITAFAWVGTLCMGVWASFVLFSLVLDLAGCLPGLISEHLATALALALAVFSSIIGWITTVLGPKLTRYTLALSPSVKGLKILQISDLHIGATLGARYIERVVQMANRENPDLVFLTGDLADAKPSSIQAPLELLGKLKSREGVFFVTGNHEYYWDPEGMIEKLKTLGIIPLINENRIVHWRGAQILIAGITDPMGASLSKSHTPRLELAAQGIENSNLGILLSHRPGVFKEANDLGFQIQFSGHTHAGQFFPFNIFMPLAHTYYRGLQLYKKLWILVNSGTGYWGPANRFGVRSEISLLTLI